jgi:ribosomal protein S18 acetylase RimI-like enzyme
MAGYDGHRGWVNYLAVDPAHRSKGYGRSLMQRVEELLTTRGCPKLNIQVRADNQEVLQFYRKIGYLADNAVSLGKRLIPDQER